MPRLNRLYRKLAKDVARIVKHRDTPPDVVRVLNDLRIGLQESAGENHQPKILAAEMRAGLKESLHAHSALLIVLWLFTVVLGKQNEGDTSLGLFNLW